MKELEKLEARLAAVDDRLQSVNKNNKDRIARIKARKVKIQAEIDALPPE